MRKILLIVAILAVGCNGSKNRPPDSTGVRSDTSGAAIDSMNSGRIQQLPLSHAPERPADNPKPDTSLHKSKHHLEDY